MPINKIVVFLLPLFFISALSSCEKRPLEQEQIEEIIEPVAQLEEVNTDVLSEVRILPPEPGVDIPPEFQPLPPEPGIDMLAEIETLQPEPSKELIEIESLNKTALELSAENEALEKKLRALNEEFNQLKKALQDKINKNKELQ